MFRFPFRTPVNKSEEILPGLTDTEQGKRLAASINGVAETLAKSCLYFSPDNLAVLSPVADVSEMLDRMDPLLRATLLDGRIHPRQQQNFHAFAECVGELKAGANAARLAAQLFRLLHELRTPGSGLVPLRKVTDSALRTLRTAASAVEFGDETAARMALQSLAETEEIGRDIGELIPTLAAYRSPTICRLIAAALSAVLVSAHSMTLVSAKLVLPPPRKIEPLEELESVIRFPPNRERISDSPKDMICMPPASKRRKF